MVPNHHIPQYKILEVPNIVQKMLGMSEGQRESSPRKRWLNNVQDITGLTLQEARSRPETATNEDKESRSQRFTTRNHK